MKYILAFLFSLFCFAPANAQICNSSSGWLQLYGQISIGSYLTLGPDCFHLRDGSVSGQILNFPVQLFNGPTNFGNLTNGSQNVIQYQGQGNSLTTSFHLNPGSGTLPTGTITEFVSERTNLQAFGGNYGRWSYTNLGSSLANASGIVGEFGGTTPIGPYLLQIGIENPPATFTVFEGWRFQTTNGGAEDAQQGAMLFGTGQTTPINQISQNIANIGAAGTRDSHAHLWEGKANDGATERATWWRQKVNVTSQAGVSAFIVQQNLNGAGWATKATYNDTGDFVSSRFLMTNVTTVGALPACVAALKGARSFVSDANANTFHTTAVGGGANNMGVTCDGTNWYLN